jgi:hypothetical protein
MVFKLRTAKKIAIMDIKICNCGATFLKVMVFKLRTAKKNCYYGYKDLQLRSNIKKTVVDIQLRKCFLQVVELLVRT